jgi:cytidylate kinase
MIVAIDGPAGAGKSTTARAVAKALNYAYVDTGAMYRAVALIGHERGYRFPEDVDKIAELSAILPLRFGGDGSQLYVGDRDVSREIRTPEIGDLASQVAAIPAVRTGIVARQREVGRVAATQCGGAVLEGRDIQTVVFPDAPVKIFLTASNHTRALRRLAQWQASGQQFTLEDAIHDVEDRDRRDETRQVSPLKPAEDAVHVYTDGLTAEEVVQRIVELVRARE